MPLQCAPLYIDCTGNWHSSYSDFWVQAASGDAVASVAWLGDGWKIVFIFSRYFGLIYVTVVVFFLLSSFLLKFWILHFTEVNCLTFFCKSWKCEFANSLTTYRVQYLSILGNPEVHCRWWYEWKMGGEGESGEVRKVRLPPGKK